MYLIIDAYNLLHVVIKAKSKQPDERDKQYFIAQLTKYAAHKGHKLVVVFDGGPLPIATHERHNGLTIVHVGYNETADDYIKRVLDDAKKDMVLISSDNALIKHAKMLGIEAVDSQTFARLLIDQKLAIKKEIISGDHVKRLHDHAADQELASVMEQETRRLPIKEEDVAMQLRVKHTPSKKEKKQSRVLKKL